MCVCVCVCVSEAVLTICGNLNVDMTTQRDGILAHVWDVLDLQSKYMIFKGLTEVDLPGSRWELLL